MIPPPPPSPGLNRVKYEHLFKYKSICPVIVNEIMTSMYVDDLYFEGFQSRRSFRSQDNCYSDILSRRIQFIQIPLQL